jgi:hypothetical protein
MGGACGMCGNWTDAYMLGHQRERDHLKDLSIHEKIILK